ncbi:MAG: polyprenyl synthetase family protein [Bacteroidota bacterium]
MPLNIKDIQAPIASEMSEFEKRFRHSMKSKVVLIDKIMTYIVKRKGKQMRPMFVFLSAGSTGQISDSTYYGASLIELLHTASLVHDDVVDDALYRRNFFSINALWKNKIAVLVGDYLLSRGLLLALDNNEFQLLKIVSEAVRQMSEGELLQMEKAKKLDITEDIYYEIIKQKTASLIASCCAVGAASTGSDQQTVDTMKDFGLKVGMAFQIKDDLFDYGSDLIGKPVGIDIKEKKMTLPLIYALQNTENSERSAIIKIIKKNKKRNSDVQKVIDFVTSNGGLEYAEKKMNDFYNEALETINSLPESDYKSSLNDLVRFTIERNK